MTAVSAIFIFVVVILIHELGHFTVAKLVGIKVNEFSVGMGPKLIQKKKGETKYTLRLLPLGGYVSMEGEDEDSDDERSFGNAKVGAKIGVVVAGAIMNFILAIIVLTLAAYGLGVPSSEIDKLIEDSPAYNSELKKGDIITAINDKKVSTWENIVSEISKSDLDKQLKISISRQGQEMDMFIKPIEDDGRAIIGILPTREKSFINSIKLGFIQTGALIGTMFKFIQMVLQGKVGTSSLSGPVGVVQEIGIATKMGIYNVLTLLGFISVNLGFFNLLPIPALDGGRIFFLIIEAIRGKKMDPEKEGIVHFIGFALLISLMLVVTYKDIINIIF